MSDSKYPASGQELDDIFAECLRALAAGSAPSDDELIARNPEFAEQLRDFFADMRSCEAWENEGGALRTGAPIDGFDEHT